VGQDSSPARVLQDPLFVALFHNWHELRLNDPLIGSHQPKTVNAGRCYDGPVGGIAQRIAQGRHLSRNLGIQRNNLESGARVDGGEQFLNRDAQPRATFAKQHRKFQQRNSTQGKRLSSLDRPTENPSLTPRKPLRFHKPADQHVSVKQKVRGQSEDPLFLADNIPQIRHVGG